MLRPNLLAARAAAHTASPLRRELGSSTWLGVSRDKPLKERKRTADIDRLGIEEPLNLQPIRRGDNQGCRVLRVNIRRYVSSSLRSPDPSSQARA